MDRSDNSLDFLTDPVTARSVVTERVGDAVRPALEIVPLGDVRPRAEPGPAGFRRGQRPAGIERGKGLERLFEPARGAGERGGLLGDDLRLDGIQDRRAGASGVLWRTECHREARVSGE